MEQLHFARCLFGTRQHAANHGHMATGGHRFGQITGVTNATIGNQWHTGTFQRFGHIRDRADLRHTDTGDDAGGANRPRTDADFHPIGTRCHQISGRIGSGDVAADHLQIRVVLFHPTDPIQHPLGVTVGGIHHHHVHTRRRQRMNSLVGIGTGSHRRTDAQTTFIVFTGIGEISGFLNVFDRNHALKMERLINHQQFFNAVFVQQLDNLGFFGSGHHRHQLLFWGHHRGDRLIQTGFKTHIAVSDNPHQIFTLHHRHTREVVISGQLQQLTDGGLFGGGDGIGDHTALEFFHLADFVGLLFGGHVLMDDANATLLRQGNRQTGFSHGIHRCRDQRNVEANAARQRRA